MKFMYSETIKKLFENKIFILASKSPRRRELIRKLRLNFAVEVSEVDETLPEGMEQRHAPEYLSGLKAEAVFDKHKSENIVVVGSDTLVMLDGVVYGKPKDEEDAFRMLRNLSGRWHEVVTGVTILSGVPGSGRTERISFSSVSRVKFYELSDEEIRAYIGTGEPMDKAGAYGIQEGGALIVERIDGDFYSVMGLPVAAVYRKLNELTL